MIKNISFLFFLLFALLTQNVYSQNINRSSNGFSDNWELNYNIGFSQFYGDAANSSFFQKFSGEIGLAHNLHVKKHFTPTFALGLNGYYGCIKSHKTQSGSGTAVDFLAMGGYGDITLKAFVDFNSLFWGYDRNRRWSVYGWLGFGYGFFDVGLEDGLTGDYRESGNTVGTTSETYKKGGAVVPFGLGIDYALSENWSINVMGDYRTVLNDDVDVMRGGFQYDQLFFAGIGVSYHLRPGFGSRKSKSKSKKSRAKPPKTKEAEPKDNEVNTIKPLEADPVEQKKIISDIPIYDLDFNSKSEKEKVQDPTATADVLIIEPQNKPTVSTYGIVYRVQILAKSTRLADINYLKNKYSLSEDIYEVRQDGVYRYSVGAFTNYQQAVEHSRRIKAKGVSDAFVVVYKDGKRISLSPQLKK